MEEFLKYSMVGILIIISNYILMHNCLKNDKRIRNEQNIIPLKKKLLPIRLTAYERLIILLERISPESLVNASTEPGMGTQHLHQALLSNLHKEFQHNISQQLYVSENAWELVLTAKEEMITLYNKCAKGHPPQAPAILLGKSILNTFKDISDNPIEVAKRALKEDVSQLF